MTFDRCYILDADGQTPLPVDVLTWAAQIEHGANRVAYSELSPEVYVSTVFIGLDYNLSRTGPPLLWETMVFGGPFHGDSKRYSSHADALRGHQAIVTDVLAALSTE